MRNHLLIREYIPIPPKPIGGELIHEYDYEVHLGKMDLDLSGLDFQIAEAYIDSVFIRFMLGDKEKFIRVSTEKITQFGISKNGKNYAFDFELKKKGGFMDLTKAKQVLLKKGISDAEAMDVFVFIYSLIEHHDNELYVVDLAIKLKEKIEAEKLKMHEVDSILFTFLIVRAYSYTEYPWRGKRYAYEVFSRLEAFYKEHPEYERKADLASYYQELGIYFSMVSLRQDALKCFERSFEIAQMDNQKSEALLKVIVTNNLLGNDYKCPYSDEEIERLFGKDAQRIKDAIQKKGYLLYDPIENSPAFQEAYDEVHETVKERMIKDSTPDMALAYWLLLKEEYQKRGIKWRSPQDMNPKVRFD